MSKYCDKNGNHLPYNADMWDIKKELAKKFRKEKYLLSKNPGFDSFFFINGGDDLLAEDEELEIEGKITSAKLKNAFMKYNKSKQINRILVSKFIEGIAT
jgi:hypothetical protein